MRLLRAFVVLLVLAVVVGGAVAVLSLQRLSESFKAYPGAEQFVDLHPGDGTPVITRKLVEAGVVRDRWTFRLALWRTGAARRLKAGEYRFDRPMSALDVVSALEHGNVYLRQVTFPEGLTIREMARVFETRGLGSAAAFVAAARDEAPLVQEIDPAARDLEGYLFPETYSLSRHAGATDLVRTMAATLRAGVHPGAARCRPAARVVDPRGGHARLARREGDRAAGRAADWWPACTCIACRSEWRSSATRRSSTRWKHAMPTGAT